MPWPRPIAIGDAQPSELAADVEERNLLIARRLTGEPIRVDDYSGSMARALAAAMIGDQATAEDEVRRGLRRDPSLHHHVGGRGPAGAALRHR